MSLLLLVLQDVGGPTPNHHAVLEDGVTAHLAGSAPGDATRRDEPTWSARPGRPCSRRAWRATTASLRGVPEVNAQVVLDQWRWADEAAQRACR